MKVIPHQPSPQQQYSAAAMMPSTNLKVEGSSQHTIPDSLADVEEAIKTSCIDMYRHNVGNKNIYRLKDCICIHTYEIRYSYRHLHITISYHIYHGFRDDTYIRIYMILHLQQLVLKILTIYNILRNSSNAYNFNENLCIRRIHFMTIK